MAATDASLPIARRSTWRDDCLEVVCGIANAGGGRLVLDADVDGRGVVKRKTNRLMKTIPQAISSSLGLTCAMELVLEDGRICLEVVIPPSPEPLSYRGTFYLYQNGINTILDDEALDRLLQPTAEVGVRWESRPVVQASLEDLNMNLVTRYTGAMRDTDITTSLDEAAAIERKLRSAGLMTGVGTPTNAGILLLHDEPHHYIAGATVRIGFFGGRGGSPIFEDEICGSLVEQVHATVELIFDKYLTDGDGSARGTAVGPKLPRDAVHEAVLNAVVHKNYDSGTPVQVSVFVDRLCIDNVGRPPHTWSVGALLGRHTSRPNNPNLVSALRSLGIIDGWGNGVGAMRMQCIEAGLPEPVFELRDDETMVCFQMDEDSVMRTSVMTADPTGALARSTVSDAHATARAAALQHDVGLTANDEKVLSMIDIDGRLTAPRIAKSLGVSESTVRRSFRRLRDLGIIDRVGSDKAGFWRVL